MTLSLTPEKNCPSLRNCAETSFIGTRLSLNPKTNKKNNLKSLRRTHTEPLLIFFLPSTKNKKTKTSSKLQGTRQRSKNFGERNDNNNAQKRLGGVRTATYVRKCASTPGATIFRSHLFCLSALFLRPFNFFFPLLGFVRSFIYLHPTQFSFHSLFFSLFPRPPHPLLPRRSY